MLAKAVWSRVARTSAVGALSIALLVSGTAAIHADELDDRKVEIEQNIDHLSEDLELLGADIKEADAKLRGLQAQLPAAEQALAEAQGKVKQAADEAADLAQRVQAARESRDQLNVKIAEDKAKLEDSKEIIGQIATEAYKRGGVSSDLSLLLSASSDGNLAAGMDMADQAMRSQNAALDALSEQSATDANSKLRLAAVEAEITDLKAAADAALAREQAARDDAENKKRDLDGIIAQTDALSAELLAQRPQIQKKLAANETAQASVNAEIKARQERLIREEAERKRKEAAAEAKRQAVAKAKFEAEEAARAKKAREAAAAQNKRDTYVESKYVAPKPQAETPRSSSWGLIKPVSGGHQTSSFGWRPTPAGTIDYGGRGGYVHAGVDWGFGGQCGTPVYAAADGEVWMAGWGGTSGNKVTISHGVIGGKALATNYHHMQSIVARVGQHVTQGQVIGYVGTTGNSTGCHMHFETIVNGTAVNPLGLL
ncbi:peptidase M23 [Arthrobacter sp. 7749]|jgi:murein DD-endopeptidase MepM/ murein hydrolase activator NlpD|uniref:Peptidoglycan DD-metalloendopeptidase family protein n=1 Tax=Paeniglutamicibacter terrestris TaxID=2723403 RepID=A0ABX1G7E1_9MICC|nr:M23 family metallopeptidase [Paeniglutamicibacter terrestris]ASN38876.1 peptidase M23 [Arthrobacter sp. 7749]NKG22183.1 peptidoglycan DD-metalloendopeptidase family protein [Paeniglutamicibacter terrestris]